MEDSVEAKTENSIETANAKQVKPFPKFWVSLGWIVLLFAMQGICGLVAGKIAYPELAAQQLPAKMTDLTGSALPLMWSMFASGLITAGLLALYLSRKQRYLALGFDRWSNMRTVPTIALAVGLYVVSYVINYVYAMYIAKNPHLQREMQAMLDAIPHTPLNQIMVFISIAILAPAIEELIFRGLLQKSITNRFNAAWGIPIASLIFALSHGQPAAFLPLAVLGCIFGYLYHKTGSMRLAITLHVINNSLAFFLGG